MPPETEPQTVLAGTGRQVGLIVSTIADIAANGCMLTFFRPVQHRPGVRRADPRPGAAQPPTRSSMRWWPAAQTMTVGIPDDPAAQLGPVISERQRQRIEGYIGAGKAATAVL